jgi:hypothetical protein
MDNKLLLLPEYELMLSFQTQPAIEGSFSKVSERAVSGNLKEITYAAGEYNLFIRENRSGDVIVIDFSLKRDDGSIFTTDNYIVECRIPVVDMYNVSPMFVGYAHVQHHNPNTFLASCTSKDSPYVMYASRNGENRFTIGLENQYIETHVTRHGHGGYMYYDHNIIKFERPVSGVKLHRSEVSDAIYISTERDNWFNTTKGYWDFIDKRRNYIPNPTPPSAFGPVWCSWLYLTDIDEEKIWANAVAAKELGIKTIIVDAGWYCPDIGIPFPDSPLNSDTLGFGRIDAEGSKFPDMKSLVERIHKELGLYVWAWCTPRWIFRAAEDGEKKVDQELLDCRIVDRHGNKVPLLCTRHAKTREHAAKFTSYLIEKYDFDGLKFDCWELDGDMDVCTSDHEHTYDTMGEGTIAWARDIFNAITAVKKDAVVWFNNTVMKPYSNYSVSPNEVYCQPDENWRMSVLLKTFTNGIVSQLCEGSWHNDEPDQCLARQMAILMMGHVPEVQVDLTNLKPSHKEIMKKYFAFYDSHKENLLFGEYTPFGFEHMLGGPISTTPPHVKIEGGDEAFCFVGPVVCENIELSNQPKRVYMFNLKNLNGLKLELKGLSKGRKRVTVFNHCLNETESYEVKSDGTVDIDCPVEFGGMLSIDSIE